MRPWIGDSVAEIALICVWRDARSLARLVTSDSGCVWLKETAVVTPAFTTGTVSVLATVPVGSALILTLDMFDVQEVATFGHEEVASFSQDVECRAYGAGAR